MCLKCAGAAAPTQGLLELTEAAGVGVGTGFGAGRGVGVGAGAGGGADAEGAGDVAVFSDVADG